MKVAVIFDPSEPADPLDPQARERSIGEFIDGDRTDLLLVRRTYTDDKLVSHAVGTGIFENLGLEAVSEAVETLLDS
jgi:hypothetical protein